MAYIWPELKVNLANLLILIIIGYTMIVSRLIKSGRWSNKAAVKMSPVARTWVGNLIIF